MRDPVPAFAASEGSRLHWWALGFVLLLSAQYESLFLFRGVNRLDESWQLYTAMRLHAGGTLYQDALWVFPPAHVWAAWLAWWIEPPGLVPARFVYAAFCVALSGASYLLARRLMPEPFALLAALLVTLAAPRGHAFQLLFGFRYLVIVVLALLALDRRLQGGGPRWMWISGLLVGVAVTFRLTPAFSAACGVGVALVAFHRERFRDWLADGLRFAAGIGIAAAPTLLYFQLSVGLDRVWQEVLVHPLAMLQPLPLPEWRLPTSWADRAEVAHWFVSLQFRVIWLFYGAYLLGLLALFARAFRERRPFEHGLLAALTVLGAVFFIRSTGRSDEPHLDSVIPPVCILVAHFLGLCFHRAWPPEREPASRRRLAAWGVVGVTLALWIWLLNIDQPFLRPVPMRPLEVTGGRIAASPVRESMVIDKASRLILEHTEPDETILNLAPTPLFHVLTGRTGPGWFDVMMPGIFLHEEDEDWFLEHLKSEPPGAVVWPARLFDEMPERSIRQVAPKIVAWVTANYAPVDTRQGVYLVLIPKDDPAALR